MATRISDEDLEHLRAFPESRKAAVMKRIMGQAPAQNVVLEGDDSFESAIFRLRRDGYGLIDLQRQETAFSTVWYRKSVMPARFAREDVTMLLWETQAAGESTTLIRWRI